MPKTICSMRHALPLIACWLVSNAWCRPDAPSHGELLTLFRHWRPGPRAEDVTAYAVTPTIQGAHNMAVRTCDLYPYLELADFKLMHQIEAPDFIRYSVRLDYRWTAGLAEIKKNDHCLGGQFDLFGVPAKNRPGGDPYFGAPIEFVIKRVGNHWQLSE